MRTRTASWVAWIPTGVFLVLVSAGLALQAATGRKDPDLGLAGATLYSAAILASAALGGLIASRHPANPVGWISAIPPISWAVEQFTFGLAGSLIVRRSGWWPALLAWEFVPDGTLVVGLFGITLLFLLFPDGRMPSPRWRIVAVSSGAALLVMLSLIPFNPIPLADSSVLNPIGVSETLAAAYAAVTGAAFFLLFGAVVASVGSLVVRFRRSKGVERQQLKWFAYGAASFPLGFALTFFEPTFGLGLVLTALSFAAVPATAAIAIFRYRLYEIDRIISRTVSYGLVAGVLALVYAGGVFLVQGVIGAEGDLAVAASTLAAFALFAPLRRWVQRGVDRRFNRSRYDAASVVEGLASKLRDRVELEVVTAELVGAARSALQPATVAVWVREER